MDSAALAVALGALAAMTGRALAPARHAVRGWAPLLGILGFLVAARLWAFAAAGTGRDTLSLLDLAQEDATSALSVGLLLVSSLTFELCALVALAALTRVGRTSRLVARVLMGVLLGLNLAGAVTFHVLRTYAKNFQFRGLHLGETLSMVWTFITPSVICGLGWAVLLAWGFGREGSPERRHYQPREKLGLMLLALACLVPTFRAMRSPLTVPTLAQSPVTLLLATELPLSQRAIPQGVVNPQDFEPAGDLSSRWQHLADVERNFNVVVLVLESVRAQSFWPSPKAPPLPFLESLASQSAVFTRAYAHEPLTMKALESMLLGIYPAPYWECAVGRFPKLGLPSLGKAWASLGLSPAFISHGTIPYAGERPFLSQNGFERVYEAADLRKLHSVPDDTTLVTALEDHIQRAQGQRFAAILWPRQTHMPYLLPGKRQQHPPGSYAAYLDAVASQDDVLRELFALLDRQHLRERTVVVLVGDHGESFNEHPESGFGHGDRLFEASVHIPLVFLNPLLFHGERDDRVVQQKDVAATLGWLAGAPSPQFNLSSSVFHERPSDAAFLLNPFDVQSLRAGIVVGRFKYQYIGPRSDERAQEWLYDVVADPWEQHDLMGEMPQVAEELRSRLFGWYGHWVSRWMEVEKSNKSDEEDALREMLIEGRGASQARHH